MKRFIVSLMFAFSVSAVAEVKSFTDEEAFSYLKPGNPELYKNIVESIAYGDAYLSLEKGKSYGGIDLQPHSAKNLASEFEKNEITATDKYKDKPIRIKGNVRSVSLDAFGNGVINIGDGASPMGNVIASVDKNAEWVRRSSKGEKIDVICNITGYVMLNIAAKCDEALNVAKVIAEKEIGQPRQFSLPKTKYRARFPIFVKMNEKELSKSCEVSGKRCFTTLSQILDGKKADVRKADKRILLWAQTLPDDPSGNAM